jgi:hypothetical protein
VLRRPLPAFLGLAVFDYLAWSWSAAHGPQTLALVCGLTLILLLLTVAWLLVLTLMRFLADRGSLSRRLVMRSGRLLGAPSRRGALIAAGGPGRRHTRFTVRRMGIRRRTARRAAHAPERAGRQAVESGRASPAERIAA